MKALRYDKKQSMWKNLLSQLPTISLYHENDTAITYLTIKHIYIMWSFFTN